MTHGPGATGEGTRRRLALLFVHVPKSGGTSIDLALDETFGERLYRDYGDGPADPAAQTNFDPEGYLEAAVSSGYPWLAGKDAVSGHFWSRKYDAVDCDFRGTILREPIARALSLHAFWLAHKGPPLRDNVVRRHLVERGLDFMTFARIPSVNRFYVDHLFRDADMRRFDFIGDFARFGREGVAVITRMGLRGSPAHVKKTSAIDPTYHQRVEAVFADAGKMATLRKIFDADIRFFERWAER